MGDAIYFTRDSALLLSLVGGGLIAKFRPWKGKMKLNFPYKELEDERLKKGDLIALSCKGRDWCVSIIK